MKDNKNKDIEELKLFNLAKGSTTSMKLDTKMKYQVICNRSLVTTKSFKSKGDDKNHKHSRADKKNWKYFSYFLICILSIIVGVYGKRFWVSVVYV